MKKDLLQQIFRLGKSKYNARAMFYLFSVLFLSALFLVNSANYKNQADTQQINTDVLVVYNELDADSITVANYYTSPEKRNIPDANKCRVNLSADKINYINAQDYDALIKAPIRDCLNRLGPDNIRYIVLSYKLPIEITGLFSQFTLEGALMDLWDQAYNGFPSSKYGSVYNPYYAFSDSKNGVYAPFNSLQNYRSTISAKKIYSVWRLDAGSVEKAKGLIDKAIYAEQSGLNGQACIDTHAIPGGTVETVPDSGYGMGDLDILRAMEFLKKAGFPVTYDPGNYDSIGTPTALPKRCDGNAFYAGWYNADSYIDAHTWSPGAIGWDINSASAVNPRGGPNWCYQAVDHGLTVCTGAHAEPYLDAITHFDGAYRNLLEGANIGDAVFRNSQYLKWVMVYIGDPLYRPFPGGRAPYNNATVSAPTKLSIQGTKELKSNLCSGFSITANDQAGNITIPPQTSVNISTTNGQAYSDVNCSIPTTASQIGDTVYFKSTTAGQSSISVSTQGLTEAIYNIAITGPFPDSTPYGETPLADSIDIPMNYFDQGGSNVAYYDLNLYNWSTSIRAQDWVDICKGNTEYRCADGQDSFYSVGETYAGEWINYSVHLGPGTYKIKTKVSSDGIGGSFHYEVTPTLKTNVLDVPDTTKWNIYQEVISDEITIGAEDTYRIKLVIDKNGDYKDHLGTSARGVSAGRFASFQVAPTDSEGTISISLPGNQDIYPGRNFTLSPSVTNATTYQWNKISGPLGGAAVFGNTSAISTPVSFDLPGAYTLGLTASDGLGHSATRTITFFVHKMADINNDSKIDFSDFTTLLSNWGNNPSNKMTDLNGDGTVDFQGDFTPLLYYWSD